MKSKIQSPGPSCGLFPQASAQGGIPGTSRRALATSLSAGLLSLASLTNVRAAEWLNETYEAYSLGATPNSTTSPLLTNIAGTTVVSGNGGKMARIKKSLTTDPSANLQYQLSPGFSTPRPRGFISFKINRNDDAGISSSLYCTFGVGANVAGTLGSDSSRIIGIRFYQTSSTSNFRVYSGGVQVGLNGTYNPTDSVQTVRIWYNDDDAATLNYVDPSGGSQTLATNTFVVYLGTTLMTPNASGSALAGAAGADLNIGKLNFTSSSSHAMDMSVDDIYAGDSAPAAGPAVITSSSTAGGFAGAPFSYQILAEGATSYTATGLPATLSLNTSTGEITGTPDTVEVINAVLTATSPGGTSADFNLTITIAAPTTNEFTGSNPALTTTSSWSLNSVPNATVNVGSFKDLILNSSVTALTSAAGNMYAQSWNVQNGNSYTLVSSATTSFKLGNSGNPDVSPFTNLVSGVQNDLVYLSGGSDLTFLATNSSVQLRNSGNLNIGAGSILDFQAVIDDNGTLNMTKTGAGTAILSASNLYGGDTILNAGTLVLANSGGLGNGALILEGGTLESTVNASLNFTTGAADAVSINGPATLNVAAATTLDMNRVTSTNTSAANVVTKTGPGTLALTGGGNRPEVTGGYRVEAGTLFYNTGANAGAGVGPLVMAGGNGIFSKGPSSTMTYTGMGLFDLAVLADTTLTLDPHPETPSGSNTLSFTNVSAGTRTIHVAKGPQALSGQETPGYTNPSLTFFSGTLSGTLTLDTAQYTSVILQAASGAGAGVTKTGLGRLVLSDNVTGVDPDPVIITPNSYTGATLISAGTLALSGSHASPISLASGTVLEFDLAATSATSSSTLSITAGSTVRIIGTPALSSYTLLTASSITGTPVLESAISGYQIARVGNSLQLNATSGGGYSTWAAANANSQGASLDFDNDGTPNGVEYFMGATGSTFTPNPPIVTAGAVRTVTWPKDPAFSGTFVVQVSDTLAPGGWTDIVPPNASIDQSNPNQVVYTLPAGSPKKFARLKVVVP